ncbi:hypothetical protein AU210_016391 [Fusarium oxysporum f. sp. radicis-cucumerinum]|uniref:Uncharacterized protein n=1 Tax=Fusarium oxysporum f. sp. radicis-cucumerinum TaxID=327505 RepID=A0A2H3G0I4_FUSOX|nr:hypothetical protein AU210_016391 [Fusarium oxysporum f. sp. radicis-cucumerinum]
MDLLSLSARGLSNKCLKAFQPCLTFRSTDPGLSNQQTSDDERYSNRLTAFKLWIDSVDALAPSKASLDSRLSEQEIDLFLVKANLVMLFQSLEDCLNLLKENEPVEEALLYFDSALKSLVTLALAISGTGRRSRLH